MGVRTFQFSSVLNGTEKHTMSYIRHHDLILGYSGNWVIEALECEGPDAIAHFAHGYKPDCYELIKVIIFQGYFPYNNM